MLTCEEIVVQAMSRVSDVTDSFPKTRSIMYRRIGVRQHQLFARAAKVNAEYFGTSSWATLDANGAADLADFISPVPTPEQIQMVTVHEIDVGSPYAVGDEIALVSVADTGAELAPRMTLRDGVLRQVGTDLATVNAVRVWYSRQPDALGPTDKDTATELPTPWDELLVVDLTRHLLRSAKRTEERAAVLVALNEEETELLLGFDSHVADYAARRERFSRPPQGTRTTESS